VIKFQCQCGAKIGAPDDTAGRTAKCGKCGVSLVVPSPAFVDEPIEPTVDTSPAPDPPKPVKAKKTKPTHRPLTAEEIALQSLENLIEIRRSLGCLLWAIIIMFIIGFFGFASMSNKVVIMGH
jgi:hypothetical protein